MSIQMNRPEETSGGCAWQSDDLRRSLSILPLGSGIRPSISPQALPSYKSWTIYEMPILNSRQLLMLYIQTRLSQLSLKI